MRDEEVAAKGAPSIEEPRHNYGEAEAELTALYVIVPCDLAITNTNRSPPLASITLVTPHRLLLLSLSQTQHAYRVALCDSFNTPEAMQRVLELVSRANAYVARGRSRVNVGVVAHIARWVTKALKVFGLSRDASEAIGWGTDGSVQEGSVDVSQWQQLSGACRLIHAGAFSEKLYLCPTFVLCLVSVTQSDNLLYLELQLRTFSRCATN